MDKKLAKILAEEIADELFVNGTGEQAGRLVLELHNMRNGGGWCKGVVKAKIEEILLAPRVPSRSPKRTSELPCGCFEYVRHD